MISTSELYKQLFNQGAIQEYKIVIGNDEYIGESIYDHPSVSQRLFDKPTFTVGSFAISILNIKLRVPTNAIAKGASIKFYYRYVHGEQQSEWVQKFDGTVSKRVEFTSDVTSIEAHDKAANYEVFTNVITAPLTYPANARTVVTMIATHMGLTVDNINDVINQNIVEFPNVLTLIEVLKNIAGLSGGNFTITEDGKLKLVIVKNRNLIKSDFSDFIAYMGSVVTVNKTFPIDVFKGGRNLLLGSGFLNKTTSINIYEYNNPVTFIDGGAVPNVNSIVSSYETVGDVGGTLNKGFTVRVLSVEAGARYYLNFYGKGFEVFRNMSVYVPGSSTSGVRREVHGEFTLFSVELTAKNTGAMFVYLRPNGNLNNSFDIEASGFKFTRTLDRFEPYSPSPIDGYGYTGDDGAWHIETSGGTSDVKIINNFPTSQPYEKREFSIVIKSFTGKLMMVRGLSARPYERYTEISSISFIDTNNVGFRIMTNSNLDNLDFIASDPFIGLAIPSYPSQSHISNREFAPISRITGYFADESAFTQGNDTGSTLEFNNRWSTQNSINHIHNLLKDFRYQSAQGTKVYADPAIQLGDSFTYPDGSVQLVASADWIFDGSVTANINAPQNNEVNLDNPLQTLHDNEFKKKVSLGDPYHGITIDREKGMEMLMSPDGSPENAIGRFYANLDKGMAFQQRLNPQSPWSDFLYLDVPSKTFRINLSNEDMFKPWFAYSANTNGNPMTETPQANSRYIGTSSATTRPPLYTDYVWARIQGDEGVGVQSTVVTYGKNTSSVEPPTTWTSTIPTIVQGEFLWTRTIITLTNGTSTTGYSISRDGLDGSTGVGISSTVITYAQSTSNTVPPTSWSTTIPTVPQGSYLWTRTVITMTNGSSNTGYSIARSANDGIGIASTTITYQIGASGTTAPTGAWVANPPTPVLGQFLWTRTVMTYTSGSPTTSYNVSRFGENGNGITSTAIAYQISTSGTVVPTGTWTSTIPTPIPSRFLWTRTTTSFTTGSPTVAYSVSRYGEDGERLFMAYADTVTGDGFSLTNSSKEYFGLYIGLPPQSTNPATYAWQPSGWQASRRISKLQVDLDGIRTKVEETNLGNIIPTFNMQDFSMSGWQGSGTLLYTTDLKYYEGLTYGMTALPVALPDAMSQFGVSFFGNGEMLSPFGVRVPLDLFSFRGLVKNFKPFTITVREYSNETTLIKSTPHTFNSALSAYTFSIVPQATTRLFKIGINVPTATPASRVIFHDMMFNAGAPKQWFESANDVLIYARTNITQLANEIGLQASEIDRVSGDIHNTLLSINGLRGVEIFASNGNGLTVYDASGNKTIELTTNGTLKAVNAEISGNLSAGTFANMQFDSDGVTFPNGKLRLNSANSSIDFGSTQMEFTSFYHSGSDTTFDNIIIKTSVGDINLGANNFNGTSGETFIAATNTQTNQIVAFGDIPIVIGDRNGTQQTRFSSGLAPRINNNANIGASNLRFSTIFLANQPNVSSDTRYKSDIQDIDPLLIKIFGENISPKQYRTRFDDQIHFGYIAQDVERALYKYCMAKFGENHIHQYAMLSKDESYMSLLYGEINVIMDAYTRSQIKEALS